MYGGQSLDRALSAYRHKNRRLHHAMPRLQTTAPAAVAVSVSGVESVQTWAIGRCAATLNTPTLDRCVNTALNHDVLLVIDNYDSFTYNLVQYFGQLGVEQRIFRNNEITPTQALALNPERVLLSPGPCSPAEAGVTLA